MKKKDCLRWAKALINGKHEKQKGKMSNAETVDSVPSAMCCLGVANEEFRPKGYREDRLEMDAEKLWKQGFFGSVNPCIHGLRASSLNDGGCFGFGIPFEGLTHEQIGILLLLAIESGEYRNI